MAGVLTEESVVTCGHSPGKVATQGSTKLRVNRKGVLLEDGVNGKSVSGCSTVAKADASGTPTDKPCATVTSISNDAAQKLTIGGKPVVLDTLAGGTDGLVGKKPPQAVSATVVQTKLTAK